MKVAINNRIGGFGLSDAALERLVEVHGFPLAQENDEEYPDNAVIEIPEDDWQRKQYGHRYWEIFSGNFKYRSDSRIIEVIEHLGLSQAAGKSCGLKIVEIPDGVEYGIGSNDEGQEWIYEQHRTWK